MNKNLGILLFGNEMIFNPAKDKISIDKPIEIKKEIAANTVPVLNIVKKIEANDKNKIIIITDSFDNQDEELLLKILNACSLDLKKIKLINFTIEKNKIEESFFSNQNTIICFGIGPQKLNLQLTLIPYQIKIFENHKMLLSDSLKVLSTNVLLKKNLWSALQKLLSAN